MKPHDYIAMALTGMVVIFCLSAYYGSHIFSNKLSPQELDLAGDVMESALHVIAMYMGYVMGRIA